MKSVREQDVLSDLIQDSTLPSGEGEGEGEGASPALPSWLVTLVDLAGGQIDLMFDVFSTAAPLVIPPMRAPRP